VRAGVGMDMIAIVFTSQPAAVRGYWVDLQEARVYLWTQKEEGMRGLQVWEGQGEGCSCQSFQWRIQLL